MTDFISSVLAGIAQISIGHPFDTIKVMIQNKQSLSNLSIRHLYRGSLLPLQSSIILNSILFPIYERSKQHVNSSFISGFIGGLVVSPFIYVYDIGKIKQQTNFFFTV